MQIANQQSTLTHFYVNRDDPSTVRNYHVSKSTIQCTVHMALTAIKTIQNVLFSQKKFTFPRKARVPSQTSSSVGKGNFSHLI